jgi:hypothetical protein
MAIAAAKLLGISVGVRLDAKVWWKSCCSVHWSQRWCWWRWRSSTESMANSIACTCGKGHDAKEGAKGVDTAMVEDGACREEKDSVTT